LPENVREVFWITDVATDRSIYVSPAYEEVTGYPTQELYADRFSFLTIVHSTTVSGWPPRSAIQGRLATT